MCVSGALGQSHALRLLEQAMHNAAAMSQQQQEPLHGAPQRWVGSAGAQQPSCSVGMSPDRPDSPISVQPMSWKSPRSVMEAPMSPYLSSPPVPNMAPAHNWGQDGIRPAEGMSVSRGHSLNQFAEPRKGFLNQFAEAPKGVWGQQSQSGLTRRAQEAMQYGRVEQDACDDRLSEGFLRMCAS
jgi:hypothetical protein